MSPYAQVWLALQVPHVLLLLAWWTSGSRVARVGGLALVLWLVVEAGAVLSGGLPSEGPWVAHVLGWLTLAGWALTWPWARFSTASVAGAAGLALVGGWVPAVVLLGRGTLERVSVAGRAALAVLVASAWVRDHGMLRVAEGVGVLGLGMDATTVLAAAVVGAVHAAAWAALLHVSRP
ncbi:MAG: hypothetical protein H6736_12585 [Alphaproteobacteria bacterium]|nr:hypothetical protein [Alphaproteobacteria bacterium]MCB9692639.1 hypothetical protein [Alphaproteobacteria bacterium]